MRSPDTIDAVNCDNCGTGLDLLGGGRVASTFCGYCGSELDPNDNYRVVRQLQDQQRPGSPFSIGMSGTIRGVKWTIIGTIGMGEYHDGKSWHWAEHQLYSPTHGYAWLTFENRMATFSRRVRLQQSFPIYSENELEEMENAPNPWRFHKTFKYYESGTAIIESLQGEFSWKPSLGDARYTHFYAPTFYLSRQLFFGQPKGPHYGYEVSVPLDEEGRINGEKETDEITYLDSEEIECEFGLEEGVLRRNVKHPLRPWTKRPTLSFASVVAIVFLFITLFAWFGINEDRPTVTRGTIDVRDLPKEIPFDISTMGRGVEILLETDARNAWGWVEAGVYDPQDIPLFEVGREVEYYEGVEGGEQWDEGSRRTRVRFRAETTGAFTLELDVPERGIWTEGNGAVQDITTVKYSIREDMVAAKWLGFTALLFLCIAVIAPLTRMAIHHDNWSGSDW
jgi:hypothetical protein